MGETLRVGMAEVDITPPAPVSLQGQFYTRISEYVESPLMANVFAAESGGEQIIICACDLCSVDAEFCAKVRDRIGARHTGIDPSKIIISATHVHTGPSFLSSPSSLHVAARYLPEGTRFEDDETIPADVWLADRCGEYIADRVCEAICTAWERRSPAQFSPSFGRAVVGHCRRVVYDDASAKMYGATDTASFRELEGGNDSGIELLYFFDPNRNPIGALVNVACPAQCVEGQRYVSADYWGKARSEVKSQLGESFVVVGLCSAAGDQSPRDLIRRSATLARRTDPDMFDLAGGIELGRRVAAVVLAQIGPASETLRSAAVLRHRTLMVDFPLRKVTLSEYGAAKRIFDEYVGSAGKAIFKSRDMTALHVSAGTMDRFHLQEQTSFFTSEIHVARFADVAIGSNPFELFLDYGNQIRARSVAEQTILIQLACGNGMYLPTAKAERGGHYSAYVSSGRTGHEGGELLVNRTVDTIRELWHQSA